MRAFAMSWRVGADRLSTHSAACYPSQVVCLLRDADARPLQPPGRKACHACPQPR